MTQNGFDSRRLHCTKDLHTTTIGAGLSVAMAPFTAPSEPKREARPLDRAVASPPTKWMLFASVAICIFLMATSPAARASKTHKPLRGTPAYCRAYSVNAYAARVCTVRVMWPARLRDKALQVAACESNFNPRAMNGQYLGVWQMGSNERRMYGYGTTVEAQTLAAIRLQRDRGWQPWECA